MTLERLSEIINNKAIYFPSARKLTNSDRFEGSISLGDLRKRDRIQEVGQIKIIKSNWKNTWDNHAFEALLDLAYISCWHISDFESYLMWKAYGASKGIAIRTTASDLISSLGRYNVTNANYPENLYYSQVKYIDFNTDETGEGMLERFFYKRKEFSSENEFRLAISLRLASEFTPINKTDYIPVPLNNYNFIHDIYISPFIQNHKEIEKILLSLLNDKMIKTRIHLSNLTNFPIYY